MGVYFRHTGSIDHPKQATPHISARTRHEPNVQSIPVHGSLFPAQEGYFRPGEPRIRRQQHESARGGAQSNFGPWGSISIPGQASSSPVPGPAASRTRSLILAHGGLFLSQGKQAPHLCRAPPPAARVPHCTWRRSAAAHSSPQVARPCPSRRPPTPRRPLRPPPVSPTTPVWLHPIPSPPIPSRPVSSGRPPRPFAPPPAPPRQLLARQRSPPLRHWGRGPLLPQPPRPPPPPVPRPPPVSRVAPARRGAAGASGRPGCRAAGPASSACGTAGRAPAGWRGRCGLPTPPARCGPLQMWAAAGSRSRRTDIAAGRPPSSSHARSARATRGAPAPRCLWQMRSD
eukprot:scaffold4280_cov92-Isochrysis_galbana.AAC.1